MSRYIDADAVKVRYRGGFYDDYVVDYDSFIKAPSIDIVRCGECKEYGDWLSGKICMRFGSYTKPDDFCSYGERKESE